MYILQIYIYFVVSDAICRLSTFILDFFTLDIFTLDFLVSTLDNYSRPSTCRYTSPEVILRLLYQRSAKVFLIFCGKEWRQSITLKIWIGSRWKAQNKGFYGGPQRQHDFLFKVQNISFLAALLFVLKLFFDFARCSGFFSRKIYFQGVFFLQGNFFSVAKFIFERNFFTRKVCSPNKHFLLRTIFFC